MNGVQNLNFVLTDTGTVENAPFFAFRLRMLGHVEEAKANTKKAARNLASLKMLHSIIDDPKVTIKNRREVENFLKQNEIEKADGDVFDPSPFKSCVGENVLEPVSILKILCDKQHWKEPVYVCSDGGSSAFDCKCIIESMRFEVNARNVTKKLAKRSSAEAMLAKLETEKLNRLDFFKLSARDQASFEEEAIKKRPENRIIVRSLGQIKLSFYDTLRADKDLSKRIRDLLPDPKYFDRTYLEGLRSLAEHKTTMELVIDNILNSVDCEVDCLTAGELTINSWYHCYATIFLDFTKKGGFAEQIKQKWNTFDTEKNRVNVMTSFGMDPDLELAKLKAKHNTIGMFLINFLDLDD